MTVGTHSHCLVTLSFVIGGRSELETRIGTEQKEETRRKIEERSAKYRLHFWIFFFLIAISSRIINIKNHDP
jgi:hypothetical protein